MPGEVRSVASVGREWLILTTNQIIRVDKQTRRARTVTPFDGAAIPHGIAVTGSGIFVVTDDGRVLCFGK
ncbi:MAG: hypothetical protein CMJ83_09590 [Planctomycetes bacterium]|nr:hypothetical protein [Planctomycetota bacterium]